MSRVLYYIQYIIYVYVYKEINKFNKNQCEICSENITAPVFIVLYVKMQVYIVYEILKKVYITRMLAHSPSSSVIEPCRSTQAFNELSVIVLTCSWRYADMHTKSPGILQAHDALVYARYWKTQCMKTSSSVDNSTHAFVSYSDTLLLHFLMQHAFYYIFKSTGFRLRTWWRSKIAFHIYLLLFFSRFSLMKCSNKRIVYSSLNLYKISTYLFCAKYFLPQNFHNHTHTYKCMYILWAWWMALLCNFYFVIHVV